MERRQQRPATRHLSGLQRSLLQWLYADLRRRHRTGGEAEGVPYATIVQAVAADKASVTTALRQLMRKGLVLTTLPRGGWTRWVTLTEQGRASASSPAQDERKPSPMTDADDASSARETRKDRRASARRRNHAGKQTRRRDDRHTHRG